MGRHMRYARHIRRSKRTPSRAELLAKNMKRRSETGPPASAPEPEPVVPLGAPYDPVTVPVRSLADALAEIDDPDAVRAMQSVDPRTSATSLYEARLAELADG